MLTAILYNFVQHSETIAPTSYAPDEMPEIQSPRNLSKMAALIGFELQLRKSCRLFFFYMSMISSAKEVDVSWFWLVHFEIIPINHM